MKTENTQKNKAKFLSQYQFAHVCFEGISNSVWHIETCLVKGYFVNNGDKGLIKMEDVSPLKLKSISNISDYDAIELLKICNLGHLTPLGNVAKELAISILNYIDGKKAYPILWIHITDFMRSKGYIMPFLNLSVEDIIYYGWAKTI